MKEYTIFCHEGGIMFAGDDEPCARGWYVLANGEAHCAHMPEEVQREFGESRW